MKPPMTSCDLHFHSKHSDGVLSVSELAAWIKKERLAYCALTDHDSVAGVRALTTLLEDSTIVIPGTELTALQGQNEIHLLAYDFDVAFVEHVLQERHALVAQQKIEEMQRAIALFAHAGLRSTSGLSPDPKRPVGYTLAVDICRQPENQEVFMKKYGKGFRIEDVYAGYQAPGKLCAVPRSGVSVEWLLGKLKGAVADFIIAHPFVPVSVVVQSQTEASMEELFRQGVTGVEVYHNLTSSVQISMLERLVASHGLHFTGGSDFHGHEKDTPLGHFGLSSVIPNFRLAHYPLMK